MANAGMKVDDQRPAASGSAQSSSEILKQTGLPV